MTNKPDNLVHMAGNEAWDAYYRDKLMPLNVMRQKGAEKEIKQAFYAGIEHAIDYVREIQGDNE